MRYIILTILITLLSLQIASAETNKTISTNRKNIKKQSILFQQNRKYSIANSLSPLFITKRRMGPDIILGINTGFNYSNITGSKDGNSKIAINPFAGVFGRLKYSEATAYQLNINYSNEGYRSKSTYTTNDGKTHTDDYKMDFKYLKMPFIIRFSFGEKFIYNFNMGVYSSFLISVMQNGEVKIEQDGYDDIITTVNVDAAENFKRFDVGLVFGGGIEYAITHKRSGSNYSVFANAGLNKGLINISAYEDAGLKNFLLYSGIGVLILFDK